MSGSRVVFTELEKTTLLELVRAKKAILECKKTDSVSKGKKSKAWEDISREFTAQLGVCPRTALQLKNLWKNMQARAKKEQSRERQERMATWSKCKLTTAHAYN